MIRKKIPISGLRSSFLKAIAAIKSGEDGSPLVVRLRNLARDLKREKKRDGKG